MLMIKVFKMLDCYTVAVSVLDERDQREPKGIERLHSIAYATFPDPPAGDLKDLVTMLERTLEHGARWIREHADDEWMNVL